MTTPIVSFVMPAYNVAQYLPTAVEAIKAQTMTDWELIIVDDCSSDETYALAKSYAEEDSRIRVLKTDYQSGGVYIPRKIAIDNAKSEIIAPLDADDKVEPDYLQTLWEEMGKAEGIDIVYPIMYRWNGITLGDVHPHDKSLYGIPVEGKEMVKYTLDGWRIHCGGGLIRRNLYLSSFPSIDKEKIKLSTYIDECLTRILLYNARKVMISDTRYYYRENEDSITNVKDLRSFGILGNNQFLLEFIRANYPEDSNERILMERQNFHSYFDALRQMRESSLSKKEKNVVMGQLKISQRSADRKTLRHNASKKYYLLYRLPIRLCDILLRILDRL
ncbi:MAG: glycosyltransferase family 2 protein [Bacteroidales bacterium]|nr:glycosyltransferase family 2 protein [Bacteroidales bacterium]